MKTVKDIYNVLNILYDNSLPFTIDNNMVDIDIDSSLIYSEYVIDIAQLILKYYQGSNQIIDIQSTNYGLRIYFEENI